MSQSPIVTAARKALRAYAAGDMPTYRKHLATVRALQALEPRQWTLPMQPATPATCPHCGRPLES